MKLMIFLICSQMKFKTILVKGQIHLRFGGKLMFLLQRYVCAHLSWWDALSVFKAGNAK